MGQGRDMHTINLLDLRAKRFMAMALAKDQRDIHIHVKYSNGKGRGHRNISWVSWHKVSSWLSLVKALGSDKC